MPSLYQALCIIMLSTILVLQICSLIKQHRHERETRKCNGGI